MATVFDVAAYILKKCGRMSTWKLQKLCFYAQAWAIAWTEKPLFEEDFEAWANGPVCPALFTAHKGKFIVDDGDIDGNPAVFNDDEIETLDIVLKDYGSFEPYQLRELSHSEDPWKNARGTLGNDEPSNTVITKQAMGTFYGGL